MYNYTITILIVLLNPNQIEMIRRIAAKPSCRLQAADHWDRLTVHTTHCTVHTHQSLQLPQDVFVLLRMC